MITGRIDARGLPVVTIRLHGLDLDAILDTAFEGGLQLPEPLRVPLDPPVSRQLTYQLGLGQQSVTLSYKVTVEIGGVPVEAETVFANSPEVLVGAEVLADYRLTIDYPAGTVTLERARP